MEAFEILLEIAKRKTLEKERGISVGKGVVRLKFVKPTPIIRNDKSFNHISAYIIDNPTKWKQDKFYTKQKSQILIFSF